MGVGRLIGLYTGIMIALAAVYFGWPARQEVLGFAVAAGGGAAIIAGVLRYRPRRRRSWLMVVGALALDAVARVVYNLLPGPAGTLKPGVWVVWLLHLLALLLLSGGVLGLARSHLRGVSAIIDTAIIFVGAGLVYTVLIAIPYAGAPGIGTLWASARVAYVARDVWMAALAVYVGIAVRRNTSVLLLQTGLLSLVLYDVLFRLGRIRGEWLTGTPIDIGRLLFFIAIGAAALVPSMVNFDRERWLTVDARPGARVRVGLVLTAAAMPSVVLVAELFEPPHSYHILIVISASLILILTFARVLDLMAQLRRQISGEQVVRDAVADFADAPDANNPDGT